MNELLKAYLIRDGYAMSDRTVDQFSESMRDGEYQYDIAICHNFEYKGYKHSSNEVVTVRVSDLLVFLFERNA